MGNNPLVIEGDEKEYSVNNNYTLKEPQNDGVEFILKKFNVLLNHQT